MTGSLSEPQAAARSIRRARRVRDMTVSPGGGLRVWLSQVTAISGLRKPGGGGLGCDPGRGHSGHTWRALWEIGPGAAHGVGATSQTLGRACPAPTGSIDFRIAGRVRPASRAGPMTHGINVGFSPGPERGADVDNRRGDNANTRRCGACHAPTGPMSVHTRTRFHV